MGEGEAGDMDLVINDDQQKPQTEHSYPYIKHKGVGKKKKGSH